MSGEFSFKRVTAPDIAKRKGGAPIVALTAYHAHTARIIDPYVDMLLVGDSLGMVMHGYETTVPVPLELMIMHAQAVVRGSSRSLVVVDMPFGSYEESPSEAFRNAARVMKETGCGAIKIEGGTHMAETIRYLTDRGIPVIVDLYKKGLLDLDAMVSKTYPMEDFHTVVEDMHGGTLARGVLTF